MAGSSDDWWPAEQTASAMLELFQAALIDNSALLRFQSTHPDDFDGTKGPLYTQFLLDGADCRALGTYLLAVADTLERHGRPMN
ncbi:putative protein OS=Sphingobium scionense OX=1404341 GN=GGQ90_001770 PE=4 SV=1 [Sphingobium scionense]|uniref:Uncharacterized protein n=1 Tax=Sphingobium scionense TaxID=1404341 RepID=A0A7W6LPV5_9SPHN|nr:hypothetical protein [Sphingobium scionense]